MEKKNELYVFLLPGAIGNTKDKEPQWTQCIILCEIFVFFVVFFPLCSKPFQKFKIS